MAEKERVRREEGNGRGKREEGGERQWVARDFDGIG